jgi:hypothetical protein
LEQTMSEIVRIVLLMYPRIPLNREMAVALLQALEADPAFAPSHWGPGERVRKPYSAEEVLAAADAAGSRSLTIFLQHDKVIRYSGEVDFGRLPYMSFEFHKSFPAKRWPNLLDLTDRLAAAVKPRIGILHIFRLSTQPWVTEADRLGRWMSFAAFPIPVWFRSYGPLGVGMRTYFGQDIREMFGRDLLLASPAAAKALDWGGVRIDLAADLWDIDPIELVERWKTVMDHLEPSHALAKPLFDKDGRTIRFEPSQAWLERLKTPNTPR